MHLEIQLALNYLLQNLYNKLPRRRVNLFGEELSNQLKRKYTSHWYPGNPNKGSAYRCLKTPTDPIISSAAESVNVPLKDIIEHLPEDLWIWIDPGEVSYRVGGGGSLRVLWRGGTDNWEGLAWRDPTETDLEDMELEKAPAALAYFRQIPPPQQVTNGMTTPPQQPPSTPVVVSTSNKPTPTLMTTAAFAQTKFGSTKLKTNSKRSHRQMSPTEFSNYIKHKQQLQAGREQAPRPRSLSPPPGPTGPLDYWSNAGGDFTPFYTPLFEPSPASGGIWGDHNLLVS